MMARIHFVSFYCIDLDMALFPFWAKHYQSFKFDTYMLFLHSWKEMSHQSKLDYIKLFKIAGFSASFALPDGRDNWESRRKASILNAHRQYLDPEDYLVVADSDEFHDMGGQASCLGGQASCLSEEYRSIIESCDLVQGRLVDCWALTPKGNPILRAPAPDRPLVEQYPVEGDLSSVMEKGGRTHARITSKVMAHKVKCPVVLSGSHVCLTPGWTERGCYRVLHYTCTPMLPWRMVARPYNSPENIRGVCEFFGLPPDHPAIEAKRAYNERAPFRGGWVPGSTVDIESAVRTAKADA